MTPDLWQPFTEPRPEGVVFWKTPLSLCTPSDSSTGVNATKSYKWCKKTSSFSVYYEAADDGGFVAVVPALPGCHTQGETPEETERNVREAIALYLESLRHPQPIREHQSAL